MYRTLENIYQNFINKKKEQSKEYEHMKQRQLQQQQVRITDPLVILTQF